jgi:hypothetical protein
MRNDLETNDDGGEGHFRPGSSNRRVAWAALGGSLIGAVTGLAGSLLVYLQAENTREMTAEQRTADIRRDAYSDLVNRFQTYKTESNSYVNLINEEASNEELITQYNDKVIPAFDHLQKAESLGRLVGTESARASIKQIGTLYNKVSEIIAPTSVDLGKFVDTMDKLTKVVNTFVYKVDTEII